MFSIYTSECHNPDCRVKQFAYASCEPPICPSCEICADCGHEGWEHGNDNACPEEE